MILKVTQQMQVPLAGKCALKGKIFPAVHKCANLFQHQPPCTKGRCFRRKWRDTLGYQVCIDEVAAVSVPRQEFPRKCCLSSAVWPGNDIDVGLHVPATCAA